MAMAPKYGRISISRIAFADENGQVIDTYLKFKSVRHYQYNYIKYFILNNIFLVLFKKIRFKFNTRYSP